MTNKEMKKQIIELVGKNFYKMFFINSVTDICEEELINSLTLLNIKPDKFSARKWAETMWNRKYRELSKEVLSIPNVDMVTARTLILETGVPYVVSDVFSKSELMKIL